jgi:hypothetical protein
MWATESGCRQARGHDHVGIPPTPFLPAAFLEDFALLAAAFVAAVFLPTF